MLKMTPSQCSILAKSAVNWTASTLSVPVASYLLRCLWMHKLIVLLVLAFGMISVAGAQSKSGEVLVHVQVILEQAPESDLWFEKATLATAKLNSKVACVAHGGKWKRMGMRGLFGCDLPTPDAGKSCTADSDCAMICIPLGESIARVGRCSPTFNIFGCLRGMKDGLSTTMLCVD